MAGRGGKAKSKKIPIIAWRSELKRRLHIQAIREEDAVKYAEVQNVCRTLNLSIAKVSVKWNGLNA